MQVDHTVTKDEIGRLQQFSHTREGDHDLDHVAHALEDLPQDACEQARMVMGVSAGGSFQDRVIDITKDAAASVYGALEQVRCLHFLSQYPVTPYTYPIDERLSRGSRPDRAKLAILPGEGCSTTVNLCTEMADGDNWQIEKASFTDSLETHHIPIIDGTPPNFARWSGRYSYWLSLTYLHCQAGKGRTGVMTACYRMAVMGWSPDDALLEASNFGCPVPDQLPFIQDLGKSLAQGRPEITGYPVKPLGSYVPTAFELDATIARAAAAGTVSIAMTRDGSRFRRRHIHDGPCVGPQG
jgi:hypothetical protein